MQIRWEVFVQSC